jgi:hypothetical protein
MACGFGAHCALRELDQAVSTIHLSDQLRYVLSDLAAGVGKLAQQSAGLDNREECEFCRVCLCMRISPSALSGSRVQVLQVAVRAVTLPWPGLVAIMSTRLHGQMPLLHSTQSNAAMIPNTVSHLPHPQQG